MKICCQHDLGNEDDVMAVTDIVKSNSEIFFHSPLWR